jgi:phytoene synthase
VTPHEVLQQKSKSFALAARLLPKGVADDAAAVYAFCRRADDLVDLSPASSETIRSLRRELDSIYRGEPQEDSSLAAFQEVALRRRIPQQYPNELLDGMEMDVSGARYKSLADLLVYCHRVAGTVGLMMCHVMGVRSPEALPRAAHLGLAMQLTNICRDVAEDAANGRHYLPKQLSVKQLLDEAEKLYASADEGLPLLGFRCSLAVRTARLIYAEIGREIERRGYDVSQRAFVSGPRKLALVAKALSQTLLTRPPREPPCAPLAVLRFPDDVLPL